MATHAAVGSSLSIDGQAAGREAASAALAQLGDGGVDLGLVFATARYDQESLLRGVREVLGDAAVSGCSGEGIISNHDSKECDYAAAVMAVQSDSIFFETFLLDGYSADPAGRGAALAEQVGAYDDAISLLVFPDGLAGDCTLFLTSLRDNLRVPLLVAGGTSADAMQFERTYQYQGEVAGSDSISAVLLRGLGRMEVAVSHGCTPIGLPLTVTRSGGGWLHEIDGQPAWSVYKEYLDGDPEDLNADGIVHLCIGEPLDDEAAEEYAPYVIRTPYGLDKESGALFFPGGGLSGMTTVRLTRHDPGKIKESALACARRILGRQPAHQPAMVFQFDCAGRGRVLFGLSAAEHIVHPLQEVLGQATPWIGFHTFGEIAPIGDRPYYHNYTVALCAVYDEV